MTAPSVDAFVRARLAEDKAGAKAALGPEWTVHLEPVDVPGIVGHKNVTVETMPDWPIIECAQGSLAERVATAEHTARHDPARVLADVQAKLAIVGDHEGVRPPDGTAVICRTCIHDSPCPTLRHIAAVYAGHPDYRPEWTP